jgi:hypothetical protein
MIEYSAYLAAIVDKSAEGSQAIIEQMLAQISWAFVGMTVVASWIIWG